uniref:Transmembrane protein 144 n=1 Tax=Parascaris univalens TaxID=6257 RepID=A0A915BFZ6_PARUN
MRRAVALFETEFHSKSNDQAFFFRCFIEATASMKSASVPVPHTMSAEEVVTLAAPAAEKSVVTGLIACGVASVFFGSMFVPIKRFDAGDGLYVQWLMSIAILVISFCTWLWEGLSQFYPLAMLGGMLWCLGNATAVPIIRRLGMAMGILIWNTTNCLSGWAGGNFGLFGMKARPAANPLLNYVGLACVIVGGALFSQVKGNAPAESENKDVALESMSNAERDKLSSDDPQLKRATPTETAPANEDTQSASKDRLIGIGLALVAGCLYGSTFVPVIYVQDNVEGAPSRGLPYVFAHSMGIFLTSNLLFVGYCIIKKNNPLINNRISLPALCAGCIWIVAQTSFFIANENLSQTVSFPIITMLPGCIASVWSIFVFREIRGTRNLRLLAIAIVITLCGALMVGLSKDLVF